MRHIKTLFILFFTFTALLTAQRKEDYSKYPGYFNYKEMPVLNNLESLSEIYLEETLLKMVANMANNKSTEMSELINDLKLVQVNEYKVEKNDLGSMEKSIDALSVTLQSKNWMRIVRTNNQHNSINIFILKGGSDQIAGLTILSLVKGGDLPKSEKPVSFGKLSCVNIVGKIDLNKIGALTKQFNLPGLDKMKSKEKSKEE